MVAVVQLRQHLVHFLLEGLESLILLGVIRYRTQLAAWPSDAEITVLLDVLIQDGGHVLIVVDLGLQIRCPPHNPAGLDYQPDANGDKFGIHGIDYTDTPTGLEM